MISLVNIMFSLVCENSVQNYLVNSCLTSRLQQITKAMGIALQKCSHLIM